MPKSLHFKTSKPTPYSLSHTAIGAFGLVGTAGALVTARAGRWADKGYGQRTTLGALALLLVAWLPLVLLDSGLWALALALGIVLLDLGGQAIHVTNQSMILSRGSDALSRLVGGYMLFYAVGSGLGAIGTTATYAAAGWHGVCVLGAVVSALALAFWAATRRYMAAAPGDVTAASGLARRPCGLQ